jgi:hypothetical protein
MGSSITWHWQMEIETCARSFFQVANARAGGGLLWAGEKGLPENKAGDAACKPKLFQEFYWKNPLQKAVVVMM